NVGSAGSTARRCHVLTVRCGRETWRAVSVGSPHGFLSGTRQKSIIVSREQLNRADVRNGYLRPKALCKPLPKGAAFAEVSVPRELGLTRLCRTTILSLA